MFLGTSMAGSRSLLEILLTVINLHGTPNTYHHFALVGAKASMCRSRVASVPPFPGDAATIHQWPRRIPVAINVGRPRMVVGRISKSASPLVVLMRGCRHGTRLDIKCCGSSCDTFTHCCGYTPPSDSNQDATEAPSRKLCGIPRSPKTVP